MCMHVYIYEYVFMHIGMYGDRHTYICLSMYAYKYT